MDRSLLPDISFTSHSPASTDRRYVDTYGTVLTPEGLSPTVVKSIDTTPRSTRSSFHGNLATQVPTVKSSVAGATFNLANGIVGAGIVGLPYAIKQSGFLFGVVGIVICAYLTHYTVTLMIETGRAHGRFSYEELCEQAFGTSGFYLLSMFQFFNCFGACLVYMLVISTTVPLVTSKYLVDTSWVFGDATLVTVLVCTLVVLPLSLYRDMKHLEKWSFLSLCTVLVLCAVLGYTFVSEEPMSAFATENQTFMLYAVHDEWAPSIGVIAFAFGCQQYSFFVFSSLDNPTRSRWWLVSAIGTFVALLVSLILGVFGYLRYGQQSR